MGLLNLGPGELVVAGLVLFVASVVRGYSGFGFSAVLVAGLSFVVDPVEAVSVAIGMEVLASVVQGPSVWADIEWSRFWVLLAAAVVGNPLGVVLLTGVDADALRVGTFVLLAVLSLGLLAVGPATAGSQSPLAATSAVFFALGLVAGVVNGATAMSGLVLVLGMTALSVAPAELRGTLVAYFFASDLVVIGLLLWRGELDQVYAWRLGLSVPVMVAGVVIGSRAFVGASVESFRRTTLVLLLAISAVGVGRVLLG